MFCDLKMGLGPDAIKVEAWEHVGKSKGRKKKGVEEEETGCWIKFRFMGSCISSRSKVENSISGATTMHCGIFFLSSFLSIIFYECLVWFDESLIVFLIIISLTLSFFSRSI